MSRAKRIKDTFGEAYTIKYTYRKDDGFYTSAEHNQIVQVKHGVNEKSNHERAGKEFEKECKHLRDLKVKTIIYQ